MLNRRNFFKLGAAAAATSAVAGGAAITAAKDLPIRGGKGFSPATGKQRQAVPTACWQCVTRCPAIGYVEDGRVVKIEPQPNSIRTEGAMCAKGQAGVNQINDPDRILYPMRRVGKRGDGKWKRVTWDEALGEVATRMKMLRDDGTPEKVMFHYGRMKASSSKLIKLFLSNYGTGTVGNHTSICEGGKWTAQELTWGKHYDNWDFDNTRFVLNFGSNVLEAHTNHVPSAHRLLWAMADKEVRMVTFDVRLSNTPAKSTEWVPIRPGTDLAVVLAMSNVVMSEDLYRGEGEAFMDFCKFTANHDATRAEKIAALKQHLAPYTPAWAAKISGVPAAKIASVAREFAAAKPGCLISYRGAVAHYNGNDTERAIQMLASITGNIDNPGGRCRSAAPRWVYPAGPKNKPEPRKLAVIDAAAGDAVLGDFGAGQRLLKEIAKSGKGPEVYMWYHHNPAYTNPDAQATSAVLKDENLLPFTVAVTPFYDESAALADLILPDATYMERYDIETGVSPSQVPEYALRQPLIKPWGEARDFKDVCLDLAKRMDMPLGFKSAEKFINKVCKKTRIVKKKARGLRGMKKRGVYHDKKAKPTYDAYRTPLTSKALDADGVILDAATGVYWNWKAAGQKSEDAALATGYEATPGAQAGYVGQKIGDAAYQGFAPGRLNKSGMFELHSSLLAKQGRPALPSYSAIPQHENMKDGELILTTFKLNVQVLSNTGNSGWLSEISHDNAVWINPDTAAARKISEGDAITIKSAIGEVEATAMVTPTVAPGILAAATHFGRREGGRYASGKQALFALDDDRHDDYQWWKAGGADFNSIIPDNPDPLGAQQCWMDTVVTVRKT